MKLINIIKIRFSSRKAGSDEFGNIYYEEKRVNPTSGRKKRFVIYKGSNEASKIPSRWHSWIHYTTDEAPISSKAERYPWQKIHLPNLTGTKYDFLLSLRSKGKQETKKYYQSWSPDIALQTESNNKKK
ncbi:MAG: NADH-ubiquinone oxidoreductase subunit NDUFA12 family protein [Proteobacteria bacterium]|nr:NADH-ubiquinone oxidoreductase subunit NDUFA12 family protein [Pseudomonadota bacterium]